MKKIHCKQHCESNLLRIFRIYPVPPNQQSIFTDFSVSFMNALDSPASAPYCACGGHRSDWTASLSLYPFKVAPPARRCPQNLLHGRSAGLTQRARHERWPNSREPGTATGRSSLRTELPACALTAAAPRRGSNGREKEREFLVTGRRKPPPLAAASHRYRRFCRQKHRPVPALGMPPAPWRQALGRRQVSYVGPIIPGNA